MKNVFLSCTAIAIGVVATPSIAQYHPVPNVAHGNSHAYQGNGYGNDNLSVRIGQLQARLDEGVRTRLITRNEAWPIRRQISEIVNLERQYSMNGFTGQERSALQHRINDVRKQLHRADQGAQGRYDQWDRDDGYAWGSHSSGWVDSNRDGWDDRDYNRNGRWDDDANYGYQQQPAQPSGIAGLINSVLGGGGSLQVGQRVPSGLYGVPYQHQSHFQDGNGVYYRSDGRHIYQIDARTHTVARVFPI